MIRLVDHNLSVYKLNTYGGQTMELPVHGILGERGQPFRVSLGMLLVGEAITWAF